MASAKNKPRKSKRAIPIIDFSVSQIGDYKALAEDDNTQDIVLSLTVDAIKHAVSEDLPDVDLFRLNNEDTVYNLSRDKFESTLRRAQNFYSKRQNFEKCIDVQSVLRVL